MAFRAEIGFLRCTSGGTDKLDQRFREKGDRVYAAQKAQDMCGRF